MSSEIVEVFQHSDTALTIEDQTTIVLEIGAVVGARGPQGIQGIQGVQGDVGPEGPAGLTGPQGAQGIQGVKGDTGIQGPIGLTGATGAAGAKGDKGDKGATGNTGATGTQGAKGETGPAGPAGVQGAVGPKGPTGAGVPAGGSTGQSLVKASNGDFDTRWVTVTGGSGGGADLPFVGSEGDVLTTVNGEWAAAAPQRGTTRVVTVLENVSGNAPLTLAPSATLISIEVNRAARIRFYRTELQRDEDRGRHFLTIPSGDAVLADLNFEVAGTIWCNPVPVLASSDGVFHILTNGPATNIILTWEVF